jgi:hypothetical protein
MKALRFLRNLLYEAGKLALCGLLAAVFVAVLWGIGWVAHTLGMPAPQGSAFKDAPSLGCGLFIFLSIALVPFAVTIVGCTWRWLRDQWRSA